MGNAAVLTDANFEQDVLQSKIPVLVDFWAPWCGPCRAIAPMIEELAAEYAGTVTVGKLNTDESPEIASRYGISAIPTLMIFKGGKPIDMLQGAQPKARLQEKLDAAKG